MKSLLATFLFCFSVFSLTAQNYFPPRGQWETRQASTLGFDQAQLNEAIQFAESNEYSGSRDLRIAILEGFAAEPFHEILGPTKKRGGPAGLIIKDGYIVAQ
ncbi:MAG TPA: serine hydrolase, partial [Roseivirga sp.]